MSEEQLSLVPAKKKRVKAPVPIATHLPVASVLVDTSVPHLDRLFDYAVPATMDTDAKPGVRVRVRFAGKLVDGFLISREAVTDHPGTLTPLSSIVSPEVVLTPAIQQLATTVATRQAGMLWDVIRSAIPTRHAATEALEFPEPVKVQACDLGTWSQYLGGDGLFTKTVSREQPRAVVTTGSDDVADMLARYALTVAASGQSIIIVVPDRTAIDRMHRALADLGCSSSAIATLAADDGAAKRYRNWLAVLRGVAPIVVGTRSAVFAPAINLGAICIWDDWNDTFSEPHAPYWHTRDVAALRSAQEHTALVFIGPTMSTAAYALQPWMTQLARPREQQRALTPRVRSAHDDTYAIRDVAGHSARIPAIAFQVTRKALEQGPVLFLVARAGYTPRLACDKCRMLATCLQCHGPLVTTNRSSAPTCALCGHHHNNWSCSNCQATTVRGVAIGSQRTAEELGRAFTGVPVRSSSADHILRAIEPRPAIIVATPGAAPVVAGGYAAAVFLDGDAMLSRPNLYATEETFAKWMECISLVQPAGEVVVVADPSHVAVQALIRNDPVGFAKREFEQRAQVQLPPAVRLISLTGQSDDVAHVMSLIAMPEGVNVRGPVPTVDGKTRMLLSAPKSESAALVSAVKAAVTLRGARHKGDPVNVRVDPLDV